MTGILKAAVMAAILMIPTGATLADDTDNSEELWPGISMFGERGNTPDVELIQTFILETISCDQIVTASEHMENFPMTCPYHMYGDLTPVIYFTKVSKAGAQHSGDAGMTCSPRHWRKLNGDGIAFTQDCNVYGYVQSISFEMYYGLGT